MRRPETIASEVPDDWEDSFDENAHRKHPQTTLTVARAAATSVVDGPSRCRSRDGTCCLTFSVKSMLMS